MDGDEVRPPWAALARLDEVAEGWSGRLRGRPALDNTAAVLSNLADYGFVWAVVAAWKARHRGTRRRRAFLTLALAGTTSFGVNAGLKRLVARPRPEDRLRVGGEDVLPVRPPTSSSFPSGHTLAAFCTAVALAESPAEGLALVTFAGAVAVSRVHLGAHHASDVLAGAAVGTVLGLVVRRAAGRT